VGIVSTVRSKRTDEFRIAANQTPLGSVSFLRLPENRDAVLSALRIRAIESALYDAFGKGQLHGTIHTCVGQEFSGVAICRKLQSDDFEQNVHDGAQTQSQHDVWLGARVVVGAGVEIGEGSVVAARSFVTRSLPPGLIAGGKARIIGRREDSKAESAVRETDLLLGASVAR
jgi:hypothetical protein